MPQIRYDAQFFRSGDDQYWRALTFALDGYLRAIARRHGLCGPDLEDVIQETWLAAYTHRNQFCNRGLLVAWIARICRSTCLALMRHQRKSCAYVAHLDVVPEEATASNDLLTRVQAGWRVQHLCDLVDDQIVRFPERQRTIVTLRWLCHRSVNDIANILDIAPGTVKSALYRARVMLRKQLEESSSTQITGTRSSDQLGAPRA